MRVSITSQQLLKTAATLTLLTVWLGGGWHVSMFGTLESEVNEIVETVDLGELSDLHNADVNGRRVQLLAPIDLVAWLQIQHDAQPLPPLYVQTTTRGPPVA